MLISIHKTYTVSFFNFAPNVYDQVCTIGMLAISGHTYVPNQLCQWLGLNFLISAAPMLLLSPPHRWIRPVFHLDLVIIQEVFTHAHPHLLPHCRHAGLQIDAGLHVTGEILSLKAQQPLTAQLNTYW